MHPPDRQLPVVLPPETKPAGTAPAAEHAEWSTISMATLPLLGSMLIDVADFFSLGPQGVPLGILVGAPCAWWVTKSLGFSQKFRVGAAIVAAIYCAFPFTELVPAATILATATKLVQWSRGHR